MVKVSVIITTFNSEKCIASAINSVLNQEGIGSRFDLELIVVDDGSTDSTSYILKNFNISLYHTTPSQSGGPNKGRNIGLKNSTGDYICFLDHDDTWEPQKIRLQLEAAKFAPIITCGYEIRNLSTGQHFRRSRPDSKIRIFQTNETFRKKLSREKKDIQHTYLSSFMIHKDLRDIYFEENFGMLDFDWILRLFENRPSVEISDKLVSRYINETNLSLNHEYRRKDYYYSLMYLETYKKEYPNEVSLALKRLNGSRARYFYLVGEMKEARKYFLKAMPGLKELVYYITTFLGSKWVKKRFIVFG